MKKVQVRKHKKNKRINWLIWVNTDKRKFALFLDYKAANGQYCRAKHIEDTSERNFLFISAQARIQAVKDEWISNPYNGKWLGNIIVT